MRFLADQDVYFATVAMLRNNGHEVVTATELNLSRASDVDLLAKAHTDQRILLTRDRDYGSLVFFLKSMGGVIYLRMLPSTLNLVHDELLRVISLYDEQQLLRAFVVIEPAHHRFRAVSP